MDVMSINKSLSVSVKSSEAIPPPPPPSLPPLIPLPSVVPIIDIQTPLSPPLAPPPQDDVPMFSSIGQDASSGNAEDTDMDVESEPTSGDDLHTQLEKLNTQGMCTSLAHSCHYSFFTCLVATASEPDDSISSLPSDERESFPNYSSPQLLIVSVQQLRLVV